MTMTDSLDGLIERVERCTADDLKAAHVERSGIHGDGKDWFFDQRRCIEFPRFSVRDKQWRRERKQKRTYVVDGHTEFETIEEAAAALNVPPVLTADETLLLATLPADWTPVRSLHGPDRINLSELAAKGFIEHRRNGDVSEFRLRALQSIKTSETPDK